jgi:deoxyadenosine/deoxycytidine kinase
MAELVTLIAGNICAGKTALTRYISEQKPNWETVPEFVDSQARKIFYKNPKESADIFEHSCLYARITRHMNAKNSKRIHLFDRGMIEGAQTFTKNSWQEGYLSHEAYNRFRDNLKRGLDQLDRTKQNKWLEQIIIYMRVEDPALLYERQQKRKIELDQPDENIPLGYLEKINDRYEEFFENIVPIYENEFGLTPPKIITIDGSIDINENPTFHKDILSRLETEIKKKLGDEYEL